jgi:hypothetical protein
MFHVIDVDLLETPGKSHMYQYPSMTKTMSTGSGGSTAESAPAAAPAAHVSVAMAEGPADAPSSTSHQFILHVNAGGFTDSEIIVMLGKL